MNNLRKKYIEEIIPQLKKETGKNNEWAVARPEKVSINAGLSKADKNPEFKKDVINDLRAISGQAPVLSRAKKSISGFKVRQNQEVGAVVTLRGRRMWDFIERLVGVTLPRIRDFRGIERRSVDGQGNLNYGIKEQLVFPEISHDDIKNIFGMQVNIKTTADNKEEGLKMFELLGFPMQKD
ncbi:MAG: 50S ribosomal protein L5 [Candidatus Moranbacteria bacterium]|nr:50S ribosomal protein L5 [Candidatus Moranbacteria bacterium]